MSATTMLSPGQVIEEPANESAQEQRYVQNLNRKMICPDCRDDPPQLIEDWAEGNVTCANCGLVLETHLVDQRSEWRTFASDDGKGDDPSRVGKAEDPNDPTAGLQTTIGFNSSGQRDRALDRAHAILYKEGGIAQLETAFNGIREVCAALNVPHATKQHADELYRSCYQERELKGKTMYAIIAACVLFSARRHSNGLQYLDVAKAANVTIKEITRAIKAIKEIRKKGGDQSSNPAASSATSPGQLCGRYGSLLILDNATQALARRLSERVSEIGTLDGRNPNTAAGAALFLASQLLGKTPKTFKQVAHVANVNDSTIRGAYKKLLDEKERVIKPEWLGEGKGDLDRLPPALSRREKRYEPYPSRRVLVDLVGEA